MAQVLTGNQLSSNNSCLFIGFLAVGLRDASVEQVILRFSHIMPGVAAAANSQR